MLLALKLTLVPALVLSISLAARRWGPRLAGLLTGLPVVSGPALFFFGVEQGPAFASEAARAVLMSMVGVSAAGVSYAWSAKRLTWLPSLLLSWAAFFAAIVVVQQVRAPAVIAFLVACAAIAVGHALLPHAAAHAAASRRAWDLPFRVVASMSLVLVVTSLAEWLGPTVSGALTPFPVAISVLLAFGHAQQGGGAAISFMRGFMPGMWSFAVFCYVISVGIVAMGIALGFTVATATALAIQATVLWWTQRRTGAGSRPRKP
jgi:hypothetical protein